MRVAVEVLLPVDVPTAWRTLVDWERQSSWMRDAAEVRILDARTAGVGTRVAVRTEILGVPAFTDMLEITLWQPPTRLEVEHRRFVAGVGEWRLEPDAGWTRFTWIEDVRLPIPLLGRAAIALYRPVMRTLMRRSMHGLQRALSAGRPSAVLPPPRSIG